MGEKKGKEENSKVWRSRKRSAKDVNLRTIFGHSTIKLGFPVAQRLKRLPAVWETWVRSLGWEDPLEEEMATHSSILAWKIPWMEVPGGL